VRVIDFSHPREAFAIGNLRRPDIRLNLVRPLQDVDLDVEVKFAHALEDGFTRLLIDRNAERWIF